MSLYKLHRRKTYTYIAIKEKIECNGNKFIKS